MKKMLLACMLVFVMLGGCSKRPPEHQAHPGVAPMMQQISYQQTKCINAAKNNISRNPLIASAVNLPFLLEAYPTVKLQDLLQDVIHSILDIDKLSIHKETRKERIKAALEGEAGQFKACLEEKDRLSAPFKNLVAFAHTDSIARQCKNISITFPDL
ncbi:MAG: hypothetical protein HQM02_06610, partial [Magnetococcales bacterium]|nr:hypothetical protein [Magnetococcales bacterium]